MSDVMLSENTKYIEFEGFVYRWGQCDSELGFGRAQQIAAKKLFFVFFLVFVCWSVLHKDCVSCCDYLCNHLSCFKKQKILRC